MWVCICAWLLLAACLVQICTEKYITSRQRGVHLCICTPLTPLKSATGHQWPRNYAAIVAGDLDRYQCSAIWSHRPWTTPSIAMTIGGDFEIWNLSENRQIDAGGDDKLWIQFASPKWSVQSIIPTNKHMQCKVGLFNLSLHAAWMEITPILLGEKPSQTMNSICL